MRLRELRVDGGATVNNALMQFQSDLLRVPVIRPRITETTALGAAYLAGLAVGFWKSRDELVGLWQHDRVFRATASANAMQELQANWHRAVERAKNWAI
jgi:glycerol kinase